MSAEIRRATDGDLPGILRLMRNELGWPADDRSEALWRWKHEQSPFGPSPVWIAAEGTDVIAVRAFLRWRLRNAEGRLIDAVRAVDTATDRQHRGQGWFRLLTLHGLAEIEAEGVSFVFNTPNSQSRPGYLSMGWEEVATPPVWFRPSSPLALTRLAQARASADLWPSECDVGVGAPATFAGEELAGCTSLIQPPEQDRFATVRSLEYFRWRYGLPALGYRMVAAPGGIADGFCVFRARRRGLTLERTVLEVVGSLSAWRPALAGSTEFDYAIAVGRRPGRLWFPLPRLGPRLVVRPVGDGASIRQLELTLGDVEFL